MKQILILIIFLLINTNSFADKRFEKDLKKLSKLNSFVDNQGNYYKLEENDVAFNYWSNDDAVEGNKITIKAEIYSANGTLIDTFTRKIEVTASTSTTCSYIIKDDELFRESKVNLTFQEWVEINCTDC